MIRGAIFDMDGLMFDSERLWDTLWAPVCRQLGLPEPPPAFYEEGRGLAGENMLRHLARYYPQQDPQQFLERVSRAAEEAFARGVPCKPGLRELLDWLARRGVPCAVASSSPRRMVLRNLRHAGLTAQFACVVGGEDVTRSKPDPAIFLEAARRLGQPIEGCLVLEDSHNGVRAGHASGALTVMVPDLMPCTEEMRALCDACCPDLLAVRDLLEHDALRR